MADYAPWSPGFGAQTIAATAFTGASATGTAGPGLSVTVTFVDGGGTSVEAPTVDAGPDQFPTLPTSSVTLNGNVSAGATPVSSIQWAQLSGPSVTISGSTTEDLTLSGLQPEAVYQFQLQATDTGGRVTTDQVIVSAVPASVPAASISGELKQWHRVTLTFDGPTLSETSGDNPFLDRRLEVSFTHNGKSTLVPGFFAADGDAAESSATSGSSWRVRFRPGLTGGLYLHRSLSKREQVAVSALGNGDAVAGVNGATGSFTVGGTDKTTPDFRARGALKYVGGHYLQFAGDQSYFSREEPTVRRTSWLTKTSTTLTTVTARFFTSTSPTSETGVLATPPGKAARGWESSERSTT